MLSKTLEYIYSTEMFSKMVFGQMEMIMEDKGVGGFQMTLVITRYPLEQLTRATTLPQYGTGPSLKFLCIYAGNLVLYKGSWYLENMVHVSPESGLSPKMGQYISPHILSRRKTFGFSRNGAEVTLWRRYCRGVPGR
jgi:hypothetical protein